MKAVHMFAAEGTFPRRLVTECTTWYRFAGIQHTKDPTKVTCKSCIALLANQVTQRLKQ